MYRKQARSDEEVAGLADELRARVRIGESIDAWMRRHVVRLTNLVREDGWRWSDIGRAMTAAGITYSTGRPWTETVLRVCATQARRQLEAKGKLRRRLVVAGPGEPPFPAPAAPSASQPELPSSPQPVEPARSHHTAPAPEPPAPEPAFQLARPLTPIVPVPSAPAVTHPAQDQRQRRDPDEAIAELLGRPKPGAVPMPDVPTPEDE